ncbi:unnamed protein product [Blepharisma stoltei]|uniref:Uncharacterized protein n=1 Tax=Blepharisma stoltei TaxID=1481888 RepID=A0AAU9KCW6_9CILI|nr:unnamed protein product [Blepharisma stoltei]
MMSGSTPQLCQVKTHHYRYGNGRHLHFQLPCRSLIQKEYNYYLYLVSDKIRSCHISHLHSHHNSLGI